jgi:beta-glucuronidase
MKKISLNGIWKGKADPKNKGIAKEWFKSTNLIEKDPNLLDIKIPGSYNLLDGFEVYEGIFWHFLEFDMEEVNHEKYSYKLFFKGSNYSTKVWLNSQFIGEHEGGFTPFKFNLEGPLKIGKNFLAVRNDNIRKKERLPALVFDWFNWGGIYRDIDLIILEKNRVKDVKIKTKVISENQCVIEISCEIKGHLSISWEILEKKKRTICSQGSFSEISGEVAFKIRMKNPKLWSPENPNLYTFTVFNMNTSESRKVPLYISDFGIREIKIKGNYLYLNNKRIKLKGVSLHEELIPYGRVIPYKERENDIKNMKSLGFNALRTGHYSHDESLLEIADNLGMFILEEIPVYWLCDFKNPQTFRLAAKMVKSLIDRDFNHPSVIWWSVGNEIPIERPIVAKFIKRLMKWVRKFDDTRIITYVSMKLFSDLTRRYADVATINYYFGWYVASPRLISLMLDTMRTPAFHKPWIYTEFGAGAKYGFHDDWGNQTKYSEERQLHVLDYSIRTFNSKDYLAGWFIWIYRDFRSLTRQNEYQQGFNRKGIVNEKNKKKLIYYRIPKIIHKERKLLNTTFFGIILWLLLFPVAYIITYLIIDIFFILVERRTIEKGKLIEKKRRLKQKKK